MRCLVAVSFVLLCGALPGLRAQNSWNLIGSSSDVDFAGRLLGSNLAAAEFNRVAVERASNDEVRKFAQSMLDSGTMTGDWIRQIVVRKGIELPARQANPAEIIVGRLAGFTGTDFDRVYIDAESTSQREQVDLCKQEIAHGADPDLKWLAFVSLKRLRWQADLLSELNSAISSTPAMQ